MPKAKEALQGRERTSKAATRVAVALGTFLGAGFFPLGPGTLASAITVALVLVFWPVTLSPLWLLAGAGLLLAPGVWAGGACERYFGHRDPGRVVLDEVIGQMIALAAVPDGRLRLADWYYWPLSFILFRLFDIFKPYPVGEGERLPGGWGIMADDCLAGAYAFLGVNLAVWWGS